VAALLGCDERARGELIVCESKGETVETMSDGEWQAQVTGKVIMAPSDRISPIRLNLGGGKLQIDGYTTIDRSVGTEVFPLAGYEDGSVDDIYASHVLEHFSHADVPKVLEHWCKKLKPGGRLRVAVPDLGWIADKYIKGEPINTVGFLMGAQTDENDYHKSIFDVEYLREKLINVGMERIGEFKSEYADCSALPVSLNLQAFKPTAVELVPGTVAALLSAPRFGSIMHFKHVGIALGLMRIPYYMAQGAYWHQVLSEQLEKLLDSGAEYIITIDYDSVFGRDEVAELCRLSRACEDADAICALQMKRCSGHAMFGMLDSDGKPRGRVNAADFDRNLTSIVSGHFGLTIFKVSSLKAFPRPWFASEPDHRGQWGEGSLHPDIWFWRSWLKHGNKLYLANRVPIGHMEEVIRWPSTTLKPIYQSPGDYNDNGIPAEVVR
jgi:predicted SAM-dependent methyltransferase